jgi:uncharacterized SAM-binding protein YcdF (DUF218 family)
VLAATALGTAWVHWFGARRHRAPSQPRPAVILGARVWPDGSPTAALTGRVATAVMLYRAGLASRLVFSGGSPDGRPSEASVMLQLAVAAGVDPSRCVLEEASRTTRENAARCAALMPNDPEVLLVTCDYHLLRATRQFQAYGFCVAPVASRRALRPLERAWRSLREAMALLQPSRAPRTSARGPHAA